jgi:leader peptidase (prepilin peptidase)/N-methyltransferase
MPHMAARMPAGSSSATADLDARSSTGAAGALVAAVLVVTAAVTTAALGPVGAAIAAVVAASVPAALHDVRHGTLPDRLVASAGMTGAITVMICVVTHGWQPAGAAVGGAAALAAPVLTLHAVDPSSMGFGDVKVAAALGLGLGLADWRLGLVTLLVAATLALAHAAAARRTSVPFGTALVAAAAVVLVAASAAHLSGGHLLGWELTTWR